MYNIWDLLFDFTKEQYLEERKISISRWYNSVRKFIVEKEDIKEEDRERLLEELNEETRKRLQDVERENMIISFDKELMKIIGKKR